MKTGKGVLLLNTSFEPLRILSLNRAVVLVVQDKAEIIEADGEPVRSEFLSIPRPLVIRLISYVSIPFRAKVPLNRKTLMARDGGECQVVGCSRTGTTIDHVVPRSRGGRHQWENVAAFCTGCNWTKGDKLLSEMGWELKRTPAIPKTRLIIGLTDAPLPAWKPHLELS